MRRAALLAAACLAAPLAGCGGDAEPSSPATTGRPPASTGPAPAPAFTREEAESEAASVAAQEAFKRDFSYPPTAFTATCAPLPKANGRPRFACRTSSPEGACTGRIQVVQLADASVQPSDVRYRCRGEPNI